LSRQRKKEYIGALEKKFDTAQNEIAQLRKQIADLQAENAILRRQSITSNQSNASQWAEALKGESKAFASRSGVESVKKTNGLISVDNSSITESSERSSSGEETTKHL